MRQSSLSVYVGWDARDVAAFEVCRASLKRHASIPVVVRAVKDWECRAKGFYWRDYHVDRDGRMHDGRSGEDFSTAFSFTRYCVPLLAIADGHADEWVLWCDPDMLWRADVADLVALADDRYDAMVVKHAHRPQEPLKMTNVLQIAYERKNWTSLMLMRPDRLARGLGLVPYVVNNESKRALHAMTWAPEDAVGDLPEAWNWLEGSSDPALAPKVVHFTRGTPDMPGHETAAFAEEWRDYAEKLGVL